MSSSQANEKGFNLSHKDSFNLACFLAKAHAMCFWPFGRKNFGREALSKLGFAAFVLMFLVGGLCQIPAMMGYIFIWAIVMLRHRAVTMRQLRQGVIRHSRYEGDLKGGKHFQNPTTIKFVLEPLACVVWAALIEYTGISHKLAVFVGLGAVSLFFVATIDRELDRKRVEAMRDAAIEQSYLAARFRGDITDE